MAYDPEAEVRHYSELLIGVVDRHLTDDTVHTYTTEISGPHDQVWEVRFTKVEAELVWERSLPPDEKAALTLERISTLMDLVERSNRLDIQTHHLLHSVAEKVEFIAGSFRLRE